MTPKWPLIDVMVAIEHCIFLERPYHMDHMEFKFRIKVRLSLSLLKLVFVLVEILVRESWTWGSSIWINTWISLGLTSNSLREHGCLSITVEEIEIVIDLDFFRQIAPGNASSQIYRLVPDCFLNDRPNSKFILLNSKTVVCQKA